MNGKRCKLIGQFQTELEMVYVTVAVAKYGIASTVIDQEPENY